MGIEPTYPAWKAGVLPLNYTRIIKCFLFETVGVTGFEPATSWSQTRRSSQAEPHPDVILSCHFFVYLAVTQELLYSKVCRLSTTFFIFLKTFYSLVFVAFIRTFVPPRLHPFHWHTSPCNFPFVPPVSDTQHFRDSG